MTGATLPRVGCAMIGGVRYRLATRGVATAVGLVTPIFGWTIVFVYVVVGLTTERGLGRIVSLVGGRTGAWAGRATRGGTLLSSAFLVADSSIDICMYILRRYSAALSFMKSPSISIGRSQTGSRVDPRNRDMKV